MTRFQEIGVSMQEASISISEANRKFEHSCDLCSSRGFHCKCEQCPIAVAHDNRVELLQQSRKTGVAQM